MRVNRIIRIGDALSQLFNVIIFNGDSNYSISGDAYRLQRHSLRKFIDFIFSPFEKDHCKTAYLNDIKKAQLLLKETEKVEI